MSASEAATGIMTIRPFRPEDQMPVRTLVLSGLGDHFGAVDETMNPDLDDIAASYLRTGGRVIVAEVDGEIVGTGTLKPEALGVGRLVRMSVAGHRRGKGIGRALVDALLAQARSDGYRRVVVETNDDWWDAIGLYRACGFQTDGYRDGDIHLSLELT